MGVNIETYGGKGRFSLFIKTVIFLGIAPTYPGSYYPLNEFISKVCLRLKSILNHLEFRVPFPVKDIFK